LIELLRHLIAPRFLMPRWGFDLRFVCRALRRQPGAIGVLLLALVAWQGYEHGIARPRLVYQGVPQLSDWRRVTSWFRVLRNDSFLVGYSDFRGTPLWVSYRVRPLPKNPPQLKRPNRFSSDWRALHRVDHESYARSGYDRGHLAPNYAISRLYGETAQRETFLMTNIVPQKPKLNQQWWQRLEEVEIDHFAPLFGEVWVMTGPVFDEHFERLATDWDVEIPDAFFKIFIAEPQPGRIYALAFLVPQTVQGKEPLDRYVTSIDHIENLTGLDFFHQLEDQLEDQIEAAIGPAPWRLPQVAKRPPRY